MARLAITVVGTVVGAYFGYPGLGFTLGSLLGSTLFPEQLPGIKGPQLNDLRVQSSATGTMIPILYGRSRMAGNVIWSSGKRETVHTEETGGKGGPTQEVTTYSYDADLAIAFCEGPVTGIRKIWANGELLFDRSIDVTQETAIASADLGRVVTFYAGNETQMPDPTMEAALGAGNVSAHRGLCYMVCTGLQLEKFGNQIPNITAELIKSGSDSKILIAATRLPVFDSPGGQCYWAAPFYNNGIINLYCTGLFNGQYGWTPGGITISLDIHGNVIDSLYQPILPGATSAGQSIPIHGLPNAYLHNTSPAPNSWRIVKDGLTAGTIDLDAPPLSQVWDSASLFLCPDGATGPWLMKVELSGVVQAINDEYYVPETTTAFVKTDAASDYLFVFDGTGLMRRRSDNAFIKYVVLNKSDLSLVADFTTAFTNELPIGTYDNSIYFAKVSVGVVRRVLPSLAIDSTWTPVGAGIDFVTPQDQIFNTMFNATVGQYSGFLFVLTPAVAVTAPTIGQIVEDLCVRAGLAAGEIDRSALAETVEGVVISRQTTARAAIEPLLTYATADGYESGSKIKFTLRGGAQVESIRHDLDAVPSENGDSLAMLRANELELPRRIWVRYIDPALDYQTGTQLAQRLTGGADAEASIDMPIVMSAQKAARLAEFVLFDTWASRNQYTLSLPEQYTLLEPCDVIAIGDEYRSMRVRITKVTRADMQIDVTALEDVAGIATSSASGSASSVPPQPIALTGPTLFKYLDIPLLRGSDDGCLGYAALGAAYPGWKGARLYKSLDGEQSWSEVASITRAATFGYASTALGSYTGYNGFDDGNQVDVRLISGALSSATTQSVLAGANAAAIGQEVIQFRDAALQPDGVTYRLSGLLRGRFGTEDKIVGHTAGDGFVLLQNSGVLTLPGTLAEIGASIAYRPVSFGLSLAGSLLHYVSSTGRAFKPLSPIELGAGVKGNGDIEIRWTRRSRYFAPWGNYEDVPLGEAAEAYEVEIYSSSSFAIVKRTLAGLTGQSATYTAAQQIADLGTAVGQVHVRIYQLSASIGRGRAAEASINCLDSSSQLLLHFDDTAGSTNIYDVYGHDITQHVFPVTIQTTSPSPKFGTGWANFNGGQSTNIIPVPGSTEFQLGASDFTIEAWIHVTNLASSNPTIPRGICSHVSTGTSKDGYRFTVQNNGAVRFEASTNNGASFNVDLLSAAGLIPQDTTWRHVAVTRDGNIWRLFVAGTLRATASVSGSVKVPTSLSLFRIGVGQSDSAFSMGFYGGMDEFRLSKACRYNANFTPNTGAFLG